MKRTKRPKSSDYYRVLALRTVGNFLVISSLFMIVKTFYLPIAEEVRYFIDNQTHKTYIVSDHPRPKGLLAHELLDQGNVQILTPQDPDFSLIIPKIGANSRVLSNIDPSDHDAYLAALQKGVAHAEGTLFPGEGGHIFLFAHSTDYFWNVGAYNAVFYLLYKLGKGDEVDLFYRGHRFIYKVVDTRIVDPTQIEYLTRKTDKEFLTLQTCWPPGTTFKRFLVFATPIAE